MRSLLGAPSLRSSARSSSARSSSAKSSIRPRSTRPGDRLSIIVLRGGRSPIGIDLESGALVQATAPLDPDAHDPHHPPLRCFDVAVGRLSTVDRSDELLAQQRSAARIGAGFLAVASADDVDVWTPELAVLDRPLRHVGHIGARRAARLIRPLLHPRTGPILGFHGPAAPLWSIDGTGPTISIVRPDSTIGVKVSEHGVDAAFRWRGILHYLPLEAPEVLARLDWLEPGLTTGPRLSDAIGLTPQLLVVRLAAPVDGMCHKVAAGFIPRL